MGNVKWSDGEEEGEEGTRSQEKTERGKLKKNDVYDPITKVDETNQAQCSTSTYHELEVDSCPADPDVGSFRSG